MPTLQDLCMYLAMYCSLSKSGRLICIGRCWEFRFAMLTSVRVKLFTGSSRKTSLYLSKMFFKDKLLGLRKMAVLFTWSSCWEATVDRDFLHHFCIISCVNHITSVPHSCVLAFTVALS